MKLSSNQIICALDFDSISKAEDFVASINHDIIFKIGMEFFYSFGLEGVSKIRNLKKDAKLFLDLKLHDIPNTVVKGIYPLVKKVQPYMLTLHIAGGKKMLQKSVAAVTEVSIEYNIKKPLLLGVTVLTSLDSNDFKEMGHIILIEDYVENYSKIAKNSNLDGIICSPLEVHLVKKLHGDSLKLITPGIRLGKNSNDDQSRFLTPKEAFKMGSDFIVMGRPLINSKDPNKVIEKIIDY
ncbi:MAG: orotidine-5'-phosphate decarboxylase [Rhodobacteraceae bacterium]|nr:orotidine-5'-phosphate decarboxylase [Paracoccaceae bacterium]OUU62491.1 MAG: orotidine-5'-phosphate decarboxylase [Alphaproteobacteria bacterium TMED62]|tara:strand:- start:30619 stop:31332 length:714 start_codon:yes stop_codon:yes gene_type:complete